MESMRQSDEPGRPNLLGGAVGPIGASSVLATAVRTDQTSVDLGVHLRRGRGYGAQGEAVGAGRQRA